MNAISFKSLAPPRVPPVVRWGLILALLYFPVCGLIALPFGGGGRYLTVLAGPLSLLFLLAFYWREPRTALGDALAFAAPFAPFLIACLIVVLVHPNATIGDPFSRVFWGAIIAVAALRVAPSRPAIYSAAALGALAYCAVAVRDVVMLGAVRAGAEMNEIIFAQTAMLTAGLTVIGAYAERSSPWALRAGWLVAGCAGLASVALSGSRGPLLAVFLLGVLLAADAWKRGHRRAIIVTALIASTVALLTLVLTPLGDRVHWAWIEARDYFFSTEPLVTSTGVRLELWRIALMATIDRPLLGYGYSTVTNLANQLTDLRFLPPDLLAQFHHFHSDWAHALMAGGLVLFAGIIFTVAFLIRAANKDLPRIWLITSMLVFGLTDIAFFRKPSLTVFIAAWALLYASHPRLHHAAEARPVYS